MLPGSVPNTITKIETPIIIEKTPENAKIRNEIKAQVLENVHSILNKAIDKMQ